MGAVWQQAVAAFRLPGIPAPVFVPNFAPPWTIDANRRAIPYSGPDAPNILTTRGRIFGAAQSERIIDDNTFESQIFGRRLVYRGGMFWSGRWRQSTSAGLADVPGGAIRMSDPYRSPALSVYDLPTLGRTLIVGSDGLYLFDGTRIEPVRDGQREKYGDFPQVVDLTAIGRVLIVASKGIYELTRGGALVARSMDFPAAEFPAPDFVDWPAAKMALVGTKAGVFLLDQNLHVAPILGGDQVEDTGTGFFRGEIEGTHDMILTGSRGFFLAVDAESTGTETCDHAQRLHDAIPESDLCLRPMAGTDEHAIGFAIGGMIEAPVRRGLLIDTTAGLFLRKLDRSLVNLQPRTGQYTRDLVRLPWSDEIVAAGPDSAVVHTDLSIQSIGRGLELRAVMPSIQTALIAPDTGSIAYSILRAERGNYQLQKTKLQDVEGFADTPWLKGVLLWTRAGLFMLNHYGNASPVDFADSGNSSPARFGLQAAFYDAVYAGVSDMLAVQRFHQVYVRQQKAGWWRIMPDLQWLPIHFLPNELALAYFDPGAGDFLIGTTSGVYAINREGNAVKIDRPDGPARAVRDFKRVGDEVIAGGDDGLFEIRRMSHITHVADGDADHIGAVLAITDVSFARLAIVTASNGTFEYQAGMLKRIADLSQAQGASAPRVFPNLHLVVVAKRFIQGPLLFELARRGSDGACSRNFVEAP